MRKEAASGATSSNIRPAGSLGSIIRRRFPDSQVAKAGANQQPIVAERIHSGDGVLVVQKFSRKNVLIPHKASEKHCSNKKLISRANTFVCKPIEWPYVTGFHRSSEASAIKKIRALQDPIKAAQCLRIHGKISVQNEDQFTSDRN